MLSQNINRCEKYYKKFRKLNSPDTATGAFIVKFRINWALCTGEVRKPRLPGDESVSLFLGFTIVVHIYFISVDIFYEIELDFYAISRKNVNIRKLKSKAEPKTIVKFRINRTPCAGSVRKPNLPGDESVSLFLRFTINSPDTAIFCISSIPIERRSLHRQLPQKGGKRPRYGGTRCLGYGKGTLVKHIKYGLAVVCGYQKGRLSLQPIGGGKRITRSAKVSDCKILRRLNFRYQPVNIPQKIQQEDISL